MYWSFLWVLSTPSVGVHSTEDRDWASRVCRSLGRVSWAARRESPQSAPPSGPLRRPARWQDPPIKHRKAWCQSTDSKVSYHDCFDESLTFEKDEIKYHFDESLSLEYNDQNTFLMSPLSLEMSQNMIVMNHWRSIINYHFDEALSLYVFICRHMLLMSACRQKWIKIRLWRILVVEKEWSKQRARALVSHISCCCHLGGSGHVGNDVHAMTMYNTNQAFKHSACYMSQP